MSTPSEIDRCKLEISRIEAHLSELEANEGMLVDAIRHIDIDLDNTIDGFTATTGRPADEFFEWRKKAQWARYYKQKALSSTREQQQALRYRLTNEQMRLLALEAGYVGTDADRLLRALYHLTMDLLGHTGYQLDEHQVGLIAAVRYATERPPSS